MLLYRLLLILLSVCYLTVSVMVNEHKEEID